MVRPDEHIKEDINRAYVAAVVAQAGYKCEFTAQGDYGTDVCIEEIQEFPDGTFGSLGYEFKAQLKASHVYRKTDEDITYALKAAAYNRLARYQKAPIFLLLFCIPQEPRERMWVEEDFLRLHHGCYWYDRPTTLTENTSSVSIRIPRHQLFTPESCKYLMDRVKNGEW